MANRLFGRCLWRPKGWPVELSAVAIWVGVRRFFSKIRSRREGQAHDTSIGRLRENWEGPISVCDPVLKLKAP